jgi:hypothetical protein
VKNNDRKTKIKKKAIMRDILDQKVIDFSIALMTLNHILRALEKVRLMVKTQPMLYTRFIGALRIPCFQDTLNVPQESKLMNGLNVKKPHLS